MAKTKKATKTKAANAAKAKAKKATGPDNGSNASPKLKIEYVSVNELTPFDGNPMNHPAEAITAIERSVSSFGWTNPLIVRRDDNTILAGHARLEVAKNKGMKKVPCIMVDMDEANSRAYLIADNQTARISDWDDTKLADLLADLRADHSIDETLSGFDASQIDELLAGMNGDGDGGGFLDLSKPPIECPQYEPPFQWFGGKSRVAPVVWQAFGDVPCYCEPFFGAGSVLFRRPNFSGDRTETVNDADGFVANFWRAVQHAPHEVAEHANWPVNENDLHARHVWLLGRRDSMAPQLEGDPDWYDAKVAGWWVWGQCCWIGSGWCSGDGPWRVVDGKLVAGDDGQGVNRQLPHLSDDGQGVNRKLPHLSNDGRGVNRQRPHLGDDGRGACELYSQSLREYMLGLADRLRRVRVCCGDWTRVLGGKSGDAVSHLVVHDVCGVFLDPPYDLSERDDGLYSTDSSEISTAVRQWAIRYGDDPRFRIALCGYEGEHDMPDNWQAAKWKAAGGMAGLAKSKTRGQDNAYRERIWFSPGCHEVGEGDIEPT